jgi:2-succinyl-5-enolpyruvyl-6-hydroxy-3-cyclohexene-1-carboxylate synthase
MNTKITKTLAALLARGVEEFVVCPGARDAGIIEALAGMEAGGAVRLWTHFEERGAGFFALGRTMAGCPCAVVTTSGTAVAELLPAVVEAHYQRRPLVLLTADRPAAFRGSGAPQAIEQAGIFGPYVEGCDDIGTAPEASAPLGGWSGTRPWQVNLCLGEEEFGAEGRSDLPETAAPAEAAAAQNTGGGRTDLGGMARFLRECAGRGLVVMLGDLEPEDREEVFHFLMDLGAPVVAEATSGLREILADLALPDADRILAANPPDRVLRLGGVPSGRFWRDLENLPEVGVCSVTRAGFAGLARESMVVAGAVERTLRGLGPVDPCGDPGGFLRRAAGARARLDECLGAFPDSEPGMMRILSVYASLGSSVFLGNSLPIREWNEFAQWTRPVTDVRASRGANGIDGQISTWLGATAESADAWAAVGDLTALYDLAAPALLAQTEPVGRVLAVVNNSGGRIFDRVPRLRKLSVRAREILRAAQNARFGHWAAMWEMEHIAVRAADEFEALEQRDPARPLLLEIIPDEAQTAGFTEARASGW